MLRRPAPLLFRGIGVAVLFLLAFAADRLTSQRESQIWGSIAIVLSTVFVLSSAWRYLLAVSTWATVWVVFNVVRAWADNVPWANARAHYVPRTEHNLLGASPTRFLQGFFYHADGPGPVDYIATAVHLSFFIAPHALALVLLIRSQTVFPRYLAATAFMLAAGAIIFVLLPTTPPWLYSRGRAGEPEIRIADVVLTHFGLLRGTNATAVAGTNLTFERNPLAAMPSIHFAATALIAAVALSRRRHRLIALLYCVAMGWALVYLGEHNALDIMVGGALAAASWRVAGFRTLSLDEGFIFRRQAGLTYREIVPIECPPMTKPRYGADIVLVRVPGRRRIVVETHRGRSIPRD